MSDKPRWEIIHGDSLTVLESFPPSTFDAVITDPPYASGGRTQAEKSKATAKKYSSMGGNAPPDFDGDAKDQRSWTRWAAEWLYLARRAAKPGAPVCMFIDWRQLPCASDALQWAGWIWRGIAVFEYTRQTRHRAADRHIAVRAPNNVFCLLPETPLLRAGVSLVPHGNPAPDPACPLERIAGTGKLPPVNEHTDRRAGFCRTSL